MLGCGEPALICETFDLNRADFSLVGLCGSRGERHRDWGKGASPGSPTEELGSSKPQPPWEELKVREVPVWCWECR